MHKPLRIIKDDPRVRLSQQVNLTPAIRAALPTLPVKFTGAGHFERIPGIGYGGGIRTLFHTENRNKVENIVQTQGPQFKELYYRPMAGLLGVYRKIHRAGHIAECKAGSLAQASVRFLETRRLSTANVEDVMEYLT